MNKYLVVHFLDSIPKGQRFESSAWPLHLTVIPPFTTSAERDDVEEVLSSARTRPMELAVATKAFYGPRRIPVMEVDSTIELQELHGGLIEVIDGLQAIYANDQHVREGFRPHVTVQKSGMAEPGQTIRMDFISLVGYPTDGTREVLTHFPLGSGVVPSSGD